MSLNMPRLTLHCQPCFYREIAEDSQFCSESTEVTQNSSQKRSPGSLPTGSSQEPMVAKSLCPCLGLTRIPHQPVARGY